MLAIASPAIADDRSADVDVVARAPEDTLHVERFRGNVPGRRTLDRQMAVSGPDRDMDVDYLIELGTDLNPEQIELPKCGVLRLYDSEEGSVPRWIALDVQTAPSSTPHDTTADIGDRPGEKILMLYPPDVAWTSGYMFVSFQCNGQIDVEYPVWVLVPLSAQEAVGSTSSPSSAEDVEEEGGETPSADAGCAVRPGAASGGAGFALAMLAIAAQTVRRRRAVR